MKHKKTPFPPGELHSNEFINPKTGIGNNPIPEVNDLFVGGEWNERTGVVNMHDVGDEVVVYLYDKGVKVECGRKPQNAFTKCGAVVEGKRIKLSKTKQYAKQISNNTNSVRPSSLCLRRTY